MASPIQRFVGRCVKKEGKKSSMNMGDGMEFTKIMNEELDGALYQFIRQKEAGAPITMDKPPAAWIAPVNWLRAVFYALLIVGLSCLFAFSLINSVQTSVTRSSASAESGLDKAVEQVDTAEIENRNDRYSAACQVLVNKAYDEGRTADHNQMRYYMIAEGIKVGKKIMVEKCDCTEE